MTGRARQLPLPWPQAASNARADLVDGDSNRLAVSALDAWPDWPHPVLFVVGPAGSGKTHLGTAWSEISGAEIFRPADVTTSDERFAVFLDDIDRRGFDEGELFALLNAARLGGGTILATARVRPAELDIALPDLRSRLQAATIVELGSPDDTLLAAVLTKLFADRQIEIDPKLVTVMLARMERSLDMARRLVERVDREALASGGRATRRLVLDVLAGIEDSAGPSS